MRGSPIERWTDDEDRRRPPAAARRVRRLRPGRLDADRGDLRRRGDVRGRRRPVRFRFRARRRARRGDTHPRATASRHDLVGCRGHGRRGLGPPVHLESRSRAAERGVRSEPVCEHGRSGTGGGGDELGLGGGLLRLRLEPVRRGGGVRALHAGRVARLHRPRLRDPALRERLAVRRPLRNRVVDRRLRLRAAWELGRTATVLILAHLVDIRPARSRSTRSGAESVAPIGPLRAPRERCRGRPASTSAAWWTNCRCS